MKSSKPLLATSRTLPSRLLSNLATLCFAIQVLAVLPSTTVFGQNTDEQGIKPYGSYHAGDIDVVNLENGKVELHIPLVEYVQRGGKLKLRFEVRYTPGLWNETKPCVPQPNGSCVTYYFWQEASKTGQMILILDQDVPNIVGTTIMQDPQCPGGCNVTVSSIQLADGALHPLGNLVQTGSNVFETLDATGMKLDSSSNTVTLSDGTRYVGIYSTAPLIEDANGNQITFSPTTGAITDTLGRSIPWGNSTFTSTSDYSGCTGSLPTVSASLWAIPWANGSTNTFKFCYANVQVFTHHWAQDDSTHYEPNGPVSMLQSIVLPTRRPGLFSMRLQTPMVCAGETW